MGKIIAFIKVGQKEHIELLQKEGLLYMNPLGYYRSCEGMSKDKSEGAKEILQGRRTKFVIFPHNSQSPSQIKRVISFESTHTEDLKNNVYCMHTIEDDGVIINEVNFKRADYALVIYDCGKFINQLEEFNQKNKLNITYRLVEYVDKDTYHGPLGCFRKYKEYEHEKEFRILLEPSEGKTLKLYIGSLQDISIMVQANEVTNIIKAKFNLS